MSDCCRRSLAKKMASKVQYMGEFLVYCKLFRATLGDLEMKLVEADVHSFILDKFLSMAHSKILIIMEEQKFV